MKSIKLEARKTRFFSKKILLVVSVVYVVMSIGAFITYELRLEETLLQIPPEARPYAGDTVQFFATSWFGLIVAVGGLLGVLWVFALKRRVAL